MTDRFKDAAPSAGELQPPSEGMALRRELGLYDAIAIVAGTIIGSGIFLVPSSGSVSNISTSRCCCASEIEDRSIHDLFGHLLCIDMEPVGGVNLEPHRMALHDGHERLREWTSCSCGSWRRRP